MISLPTLHRIIRSHVISRLYVKRQQFLQIITLIDSSDTVTMDISHGIGSTQVIIHVVALFHDPQLHQQSTSTILGIKSILFLYVKVVLVEQLRLVFLISYLQYLEYLYKQAIIDQKQQSLVITCGHRRVETNISYLSVFRDHMFPKNSLLVWEGMVINLANLSTLFSILIPFLHLPIQQITCMKILNNYSQIY